MESKDALPSTRPHIESTEGIEALSIFVAPVPDDRLVIHRNPLYGMMIPFDKNASLLSQSSATMLNNYQYNLKLARSVVLIPDR